MAAGTCGLAGLRPWGPAGQALQPSSRWLLCRQGRAVETDLSGGSGHWLVLSGQPSSCLQASWAQPDGNGPQLFQVGLELLGAFLPLTL